MAPLGRTGGAMRGLRLSPGRLNTNGPQRKLEHNLMDKGASILADRGIVKISGAEALDFLHRLVTNSLLDLKPGEARYAALLSGQGKLPRMVIECSSISLEGSAELRSMLGARGVELLVFVRGGGAHGEPLIK